MTWKYGAPWQWETAAKELPPVDLLFAYYPSRNLMRLQADITNMPKNGFSGRPPAPPTAESRPDRARGAAPSTKASTGRRHRRPKFHGRSAWHDLELEPLSSGQEHLLC